MGCWQQEQHARRGDQVHECERLLRLELLALLAWRRCFTVHGHGGHRAGFAAGGCERGRPALGPALRSEQGTLRASAARARTMTGSGHSRYWRAERAALVRRSE